MKSELEKYGIQMPAFSKIGGILANELSVDEAACERSSDGLQHGGSVPWLQIVTLSLTHAYDLKSKNALKANKLAASWI